MPAAVATRARTANAAACNNGKVVLVGGKHYTGLSWFMGVENPSRQVCRDVRSDCAANALELKDGNLTTLAGKGFAGLPSAALLPLFKNPNKRPSGIFEATIVQADKEILKLRKCDGELAVANRQVLWLVTDLEHFFKQRRSA